MSDCTREQCGWKLLRSSLSDRHQVDPASEACRLLLLTIHAGMLDDF